MPPSLQNEHGSAYSATSIRNGLVAGYSAGICGIVVGHPLDSYKVLLQTSGGSVSGSSRNPIQKRSIRALYAGMTGPLITVGALQSINFAIYDTVRRLLYQRQLRSENVPHIGDTHNDYLYYDNVSNVAVASFVASGSQTILSAPMSIVKTKQQIMVWGFRRAISETYHSGTNGKSSQPNVLRGLRNFYKGYPLHLVVESFGRSVYMFTYEALKRKLAQSKCCETTSSSDRVSTQNLTVPERMVCASAAGMTSWTFIFPADVVRSRFYALSLKSQSSLTAFDGITLAQQMVREQGIKSLYRGLSVTVARAGPVAAAVLPVYDSILVWISS